MTMRPVSARVGNVGNNHVPLAEPGWPSMSSIRLCLWAACGALIVAVVVGCHSATPVEQMGAAQNDLYGEAMALSQCESTNGYSSKRCADQRAAYDRDLAAFKSKYGK